MTPLPELGSTFSGYRLEAYIARGGMGIVYSATHLRLERTVALKLLAPELAEDQDFRTRFLKEAQLAASLEHPSVVPVYDAGEEEGLLYLAMRYLQGGDLRELLQKQGRLSLERSLAITEQVAGALDAAHARGLVHRDVKPANILFDERQERAYLGDFGVAKRQSSKGLTQTGSFLGSVDYCAPEQIESALVDGRADIYALGGVFYHCLTGQPPYVRETEVAVLTAHLRDPPPALSRVRPDLPEALDGVVVTAMAKYPQVRYATAGEFAGALRQAVSPQGASTAAADSALPTAPGLPVTVHAPSPASPAPAGVTAEHETAVVQGVGRTAVAPFQTSAAPNTRGWQMLALGACGLLVAVAGVGLGVLLTRDGGAVTAGTTTSVVTTTTAPPAETVKEAPAQPSAKAMARQAHQAYVRNIDGMLIDSARTRSDLGTLISRVSRFSIPYAQAAAEIDGITEQRRSLLAAVSSVAPPTAFSRSATLLRRSLVASIDDDLAIASWIDARYSGNRAAEDYYWERNLRLSAAASSAKAAFLREYNAKRRALLSMAPLNVQY